VTTNRIVRRVPARALAVAAAVAGLTAAAALGAGNLAFAATNLTPAQQSAVLAQHNTARSAVGVAPLTWSTTLADHAQAWADQLAANGGGLVHATGTGEGENLAKWSDPSSAPSDGVTLWLNEKPAYDASPNKSAFNATNPAWQTYGHYTQVVWSGTTQLGCGTSSGTFGRVTVCRYSPPGNVDGRLAYAAGGTPAPLPTTVPLPVPTTGLPAPTTVPLPTVPLPTLPPAPTTVGVPAGTVNPAACAFAAGSVGGYGSAVDTAAIGLDDWETSLGNAINTFRTQNGVKALTYSAALARPAMWASLDDFNRGSGSGSSHLDSRGMGIAQRVQYCSGYVGTVAELTYSGSGVTSSTWQQAFAALKSGSSSLLLNPAYTTWSGAQLVYGGTATQRTPAYYTLVMGNH
jgi:uncharacterized protein YkwD